MHANSSVEFRTRNRETSCPLLRFRSFGIFFLSTMLQISQYEYLVIDGGENVSAYCCVVFAQ